MIRDPEPIVLKGRCHCGAVETTFRPDKAVSAIDIRACQCSFCRRHGAATASDPFGAVTIRSGGRLIRYRFGAGTTDFLICGGCGVYIAALLETESRLLATINVAGLRMAPLCDAVPMPADYEHEDGAARRARRLARWTPAVLSEANA
jgi:hypothetical protein